MTITLLDIKNIFNPHYLIFSKAWFELNQKLLLKLANSWIGRRIFCINGKRSLVGNHKITKITPNAIFWTAGRYKKAEFRTHDKFTRRLIHAFYPIWLLVHAWDITIANNFQPAWNLGFDTLTAYAGAGDGKVGYYSVGASWATVRGATDGTAGEISYTTANDLGGSYNWDNQYECYRQFL